MAEVRTQLSKEDQTRIIRGGGSVLAGGRVITRVEDLPGTPSASTAKTDTGTASGTPLPADFPHSDLLLAAELDTIEKVKAVEDLTAVKGIGRVSADEIRSALTK